MRVALALAFACGLVSFWTGMFAGGSALAARVEPYLNGLQGQSIDPTPPPRLMGAITAALARLLPADHASLTRRLREAGRSGSVESFRHEQARWVLIGAGAGIIVGGRNMMETASSEIAVVPMLVVLGALGGYAASESNLSRQVSRRRERVGADLPLALDLLTLSVMAGESVPGALARAAQVLPGEVGPALEECLGDVRAGSPMTEALERLPSYLPGPAVARLVDSLCTGIERGAPLADTLRAQCDDLRDARRRELLEIGGKREILMLVPVVFLILPVVVVFALYPGLVALDLLVP